jgi:hypothetical protein
MRAHTPLQNERNSKESSRVWETRSLIEPERDYEGNTVYVSNLSKVVLIDNAFV